MERPTPVTVFGIMNIVFGAFAIVGGLFSVAMFFIPLVDHNPAMKIMHEAGPYRNWLMLCVPLRVLAGTVELVAGIGLLKLKPWSRKLSIGYGVYEILFCFVNAVACFLFLVRPVMQQAAQQGGPEAMGASFGAIGGAVGGCFGLVYPVFLLFFMTRPNVVAAFKQPPEIPPGA